MAKTNTYEIWLTISIHHNYFVREKCGLDIRPDKETGTIFKKSGLIFKKQDTCNWMLLKPAGDEFRKTELFFDENPYTLTFDLLNQTSLFYSYTDHSENIGKQNFFSLKTVKQNGVFQQLLIPMQKDILMKKQDIKLNYTGFSKNWEFLLIPKYSEIRKINLKLTEIKNKLSVKFVNMVNIPGEQTEAFRFLSEQKIGMKELYDYEIGLWNVTEHGEYLLSNYLKHPEPNASSLFDPDNAITTYYYF